MKYKIKASGLSNLTDARYFNALPADYLGFCFDIMEDHVIGLEEAKEIASWLPDAPLVAEFGNHQDKQEIMHIIQELDFQSIQLPLEKALEEKNIFFLPIIPQIIVNSVEALEKAFDESRRWKKSDTPQVLSLQGELADWNKIKEIEDGIYFIKRVARRREIFLEMNFTKENINEILSETGAQGISLIGIKEERPGWSMVDDFDDLIQQLEG